MRATFTLPPCSVFVLLCANIMTIDDYGGGDDDGDKIERN